MSRDVFYLGEKPNAHPKERFANSLEDAKKFSTTEHFWIINEFCDYRNFDWDWDFDFLPDEDIWTKDHNNVWPSLYQKDSGTWLCSTNLETYTVYRTDVDPVPRKNIISENWVISEAVDKLKFDFRWHPDPTDPPYIYTWGNKFVPAEIQPTLEYYVPGATDRKYMGEVIVLPKKDCLVETHKVDETKFDFSWRPDPREPAYIYTWGNKYVPAEIQPTLEYYVPGATHRKYMGEVTVLPEYDRYKILIPVDKTKFDFSWRPDPREPAYIYTWGNQWNDGVLEPTIEYHVPGATQRKYITDTTAIVLPNKNNWEIIEEIESFDFSWRPNPTDPPLTYVFGCKQYPPTVMPVVKYITDKNAPTKFIDDIHAKLKQKPELFTNTENIKSFDFSWRPDPREPAYNYQFGTQWAKTHGPIYKVEGATEVKFVEDVKATIKPNMKHWEIPEGIDVSTFDFSWHPDGTSPPYVYQFGTIVDKNDGPRYVTPNNNGEVVLLERPDKAIEVKEFPKYYLDTTLEDLIKQHPNEVFWVLNPDIDYSKFNFDWRPDIQQINYVHAFGTIENINTQTYFVNAVSYIQGHTDINYITVNTLEIKTQIDMFFIDRSNIDSEKNFNAIKTRFPYVQKTRYLNSWVDTISRCLRKANSKLVWILNSELDYSNFEFDYYPNPWQMKMIHVFGTQYSHWGTTFMVNKESFDEDTKYVKIIEHLPILNFVKNRKANAINCLYDVFVIDYGNDQTNKIVEQLKDKVTGKNLTVIKYHTNYLETFKEILTTLPEKKDHYIWVASSICDYSNFDFNYICDPFSKDQLHVFPSGKQKFGDTFLVDVNRLRVLIKSMQTLEDYEKINFNQHMHVQRLPAPTIITEDDTHVSSIENDFNFPYAVFQTSDNQNLQSDDTEPMSLWDKHHKNIIVSSTGGTRIVVPKEAKEYIKKELYDYPFIKTSSRLVKSNPLDIIFFSNGEVGADENYEYLLSLTKDKANRVARIDGVQGRVASQHAAANASQTSWYFLVNAKLRVNQKFDFNWQPDRLQIPKHYIFLATNPVNGLEYGHQAIVANNKNLTLNTVVQGLDFTMDSEHEVVNINSGIGMFNTSPWDTWRTSFREVIKLRNSDTQENKDRLNAWLTVAEGAFAEYSLKGAKDAIDYYEEVAGDLNKLKLSYEWKWLQDRFNQCQK